MKSLAVLILALAVPGSFGQMPKGPPNKPPMPPPNPPPGQHHHHHHPFFWPFLPRPQMTIYMPMMPAPSASNQYSPTSSYPMSYPSSGGYGQNGYGQMTSNQYTPNYGQSAAAAQLPAPSASKARVQIYLPTSAAVVWVDGYKLDSGLSTSRVYTTPDLDPGQPNRYTVKAQWVHRGENVTAEKVVTVTAGAMATVDFTHEPAARANRAAAAYQAPAAPNAYETPQLTYPPQ